MGWETYLRLDDGASLQDLGHNILLATGPELTLQLALGRRVEHALGSLPGLPYVSTAPNLSSLFASRDTANSRGRLNGCLMLEGKELGNTHLCVTKIFHPLTT